MSEVFNQSVLDAINRAVQDGISTTALEVDGTPQYCIINTETREIEIPGELNIFGVESDEKSTRVYFRCPKYVGTNVDLDMTQCMVYVPYRNANGEKDQYIVTDLNETEDGENVEFTWLISRKASAYMGITEFGIRAIKTAVGGTIEAEWNTTVASANVIRGMDVGLLEFSEENKDALAQAMDLVKQELEQTKSEITSEIETKGQQTLDTIPDDYTTAAQNALSAKTEVEDIRVGANGETYESAGEAVREQINQLLERMVTSFFIYTSSNYTPNLYIAYNNGNQINSATDNYYVTDYIDLPILAKKIGIANVRLKNEYPNKSGMAFFDKNSRYISGVQYTENAITTLSVPEGATKARFTIYKSDKNNSIILLLEDIWSYIDSHDFDPLLNDVTLKDGYVNYENGLIIDLSTQLKYIEFDVTEGSGFLYLNTVYVEDHRGLAFFDKYENFISGVRTGTKQQYIKVPEGAMLCKATVNEINDILFIKNHTYDLIIKNLNKIKREYDNKSLVSTSFSLFNNFAVIGDSYASGELFENNDFHDYYEISWGQILARMSGTTCANYSKGGLTTRSWLGSPYGLTKMQDDSKKQLYICALGINDYLTLGNDYLGTISDIHDDDSDINPDTFYGNYGKIVEHIKAKNSNALIIFSTMASNKNEIQKQYNDAIENIASHYGVPCIKQHENDFFKDSFYNDNMSGAHPIGIVYSGMAVAIKSMIENEMKNNINYFKTYNGQ